MGVNRFDVYFVDLNPTIGSGINKIRPCVVISPDQMNRTLNTVIVAPLTSTIKKYPMRVNCMLDNKNGQIALDQIRSVDKKRLVKKLAILDVATQSRLVGTILDMFTY